MEDFSYACTGSISVLLHLLVQLPAIAGALLLSRRFPIRNRFEFLAVAGLIYTVVMIAIPGVLGMLGYLTQTGIFCASWGFGALSFMGRPRHSTPLKPCQPFSVSELILVAIAWGFLINMWSAFSMLPTVGSDSLLYHIFYPACWLRTGFIERIAQHGMMTASYPFYGELVYAWQMASLEHDYFARGFQFYFLALAWVSLVSGLLAAGFRRIEALAAALLMVFAGVVFRNALVANTDLMTGSMLLSGVMWLVIASRRNRIDAFILSGISFGIAAGMKYLGFMLAPPALLIGTVAVWLGRPLCRSKLWITCVVATVVGSPCFIVNWISYGNPVFPVRMGMGNWSLFRNYMTVSASAVGWRWSSWNFFVNNQLYNVSLSTACIVILVICAGLVSAVLARKRFSGWAVGTVSLGFLIMLSIQLSIYPEMTQARQIIPLVMLAMFPAVVLFRPLHGNAWAVTILALVLSFLESCRQYAYNVQGICDFLIHSVVAMLLLWVWGKRCRPIWVWSATLLVAGVMVMVVGLKLIRAETLASEVRNVLGYREDDLVMQEIKRRTDGKACTIAYLGLNYFFFTGNRFQNRVIAVPVSKSGGKLLSDYRNMDEMRDPGSFEVWVERLLRENVRFVINDFRTPPVSNSSLEAEWALTHPEFFDPVVCLDCGFACFEFKPVAKRE